MAELQFGSSGPRACTRPAADSARRQRRSQLARTRVIAPFDCLACEAPLAIVMADHEHNTYLMVGTTAKLVKGEVKCECGAVREFASMQVPPRPGVDTLPKAA